MSIESGRHVHKHDYDKVGEVHKNGRLEESLEIIGDPGIGLRFLMAHKIILVIDVWVRLLLLLA